MEGRFRASFDDTTKYLTKQLKHEKKTLWFVRWLWNEIAADFFGQFTHDSWTVRVCGPFAWTFIADMYSGKQFKVAARFTDEHVSGEKSIRKYISRWGYV